MKNRDADEYFKRRVHDRISLVMGLLEDSLGFLLPRPPKPSETQYLNHPEALYFPSSTLTPELLAKKQLSELVRTPRVGAQISNFAVRSTRPHLTSSAALSKR